MLRTRAQNPESTPLTWRFSLDPPAFVFFVNDTRLGHFSYERYLENQIRRRYAYQGTPLRLRFRSRAKG